MTRAHSLASMAASAVRAANRARQGNADRGAFAALELTILLPFVLAMLLLVVGFGRVERGRALVDQAAQAAARSASLTLDPAAAEAAAAQAMEQTLRGGGLSCANVEVDLDTAAFYAGGEVTAHVSCVADLSDLAIAGLPGSVTLTASSTAPLEQHRPLGSP